MKGVRGNLFWIVIMIITSNCHTEEKVLFKKSLIKNVKRIELTKLQVDTIRLDEIESSYLGSIDIVDDLIYFIDSRFCWVFEFDKDGNYQKRYLGRGEGPYELNTPKISAFEKLSNGYYLFISTSNDCHIHNLDLDFRRSNFYYMSKVNEKIENMNRQDININPDMNWIYTLAYNKLIVRDYKGYAYFNIYSEHPSFNFISTPKRYFNDCRLLAKMNIEDGEIEDMYGRFSPAYRDYENLKQFSLISFDITGNGYFYICFEADSIIYKYNNQFYLEAAFGYKGQEMDQSYANINTFQQLNTIGRSDREERGFYDWIEYIDEIGLLFRSYKKGIHVKSDGLQIYEDQVLIADVDVPKNFRVLGYIKPYVYSEAIIDEDNEIITIYRFII